MGVGEEGAPVLVERTVADLIRTVGVIMLGDVVWTNGWVDIPLGLQAVKLNPKSIINIMMRNFISSIIGRSFPEAGDIYQSL